MKKSAGDGGLMAWKRTKSWNERRRDLQQQFEDDVALTLDESQQAIWKSFTRLLRRQRVLPEMGQYVQQITLVDLLRGTRQAGP